MTRLDELTKHTIDDLTAELSSNNETLANLVLLEGFYEGYAAAGSVAYTDRFIYVYCSCRDEGSWDNFKRNP